MKYLHEIVQMNENMPLKIIIHNKLEGNIPSHWHKALELTYINEGRVSCHINGVRYNISENDLLIINSSDIHGMYIRNKEMASGITLMISYDFLKSNYNNIDNIEFIMSKDEFMKAVLKDLLIKIFNMYTSTVKECTLKPNDIAKAVFEEQGNEFYYLRIKSILYEIMFILLTYFKVDKDIRINIKSKRYIDRFKKITEYIENNYKENLILEDVANYYGLSREHLARSFKKYMGTTFGEYLNSIRLYNAYMDLLTTDYSITQIGLDNGFPNVASFINKFRLAYGKTPYKYKKDLENINQNITN